MSARERGRTARQIERAVSESGVAVELLGDPDAAAAGLTDLSDPRPGCLIFVERPKDVAAALQVAAPVLILPRSELNQVVPASGRAVLGVSDVRRAMPVLLGLFDNRPVPPRGVHPAAVVAKTALIGKDVSIAPGVVVGEDCRIEDGVILEPHVSVGPGSRIGAESRIHAGARVYDGVDIGRRCRIHSGAVIGSDGFGYVSSPAGHAKIPQIGGVVIEDDVEIGANVTIDRGAVGMTRVGAGAKIDNLVHLAHNVALGPHSIVIAQSGIAGSAKLGAWTILAAQSGVAGHIRVGDRCMIGAKSGVTKSLPPGQIVSGFPARPHPDEKRIKVCLGRLPSTVRDVARIRAAVLRLSKRLTRVESEDARAIHA
ncbi:UDP-3-O-(3-hydroxymyristoyl)glucosamine N-acyltransferase [bacterium]|nr:UDP-3-O-(3-hydroxymyristoyl)glucosamine N-acyltransferase [bacterium]